MKTLYIRSVICSILILRVAFCFAQQTGIITTSRTSPTGLVSFVQPSLTGISNSKHVDGYVEKIGASVFVFPVGHKGVYRPFATNSDGVVGSYFFENPSTATLPSGSPFDSAKKESGVIKVSSKEYWDINGANSTKITLSWNANSGISELVGNNLNLLTVVGWSAAAQRWEKISSVVDEIPLIGSTSIIASGSISTIQNLIPNTYNVFSFGTLETPSTPVNFAGALEVVSCTEIRGWAWDKNYPDATLNVELLDGNTPVGSAVANVFRQDIKDGGFGTGNYGFVISTPSILLDGATRNLSVRIKGSSVILSGSPKTLNCGFDGAVERSNCFTVGGWVWDKNNPNQALSVIVKEGSEIKTTILANSYREDLKTAGKGTGNYGFNITLPQSIRDGKSHYLSIGLKDSNYSLPGSPININCPASQFDGRFESADCNWIKGWAMDKSFPNTSVTVEVYEGNTIYATVTPTAFASGNYGFSVATPSSLMDGQPHQLSMRIKGTTTVLTDSPRALTCSVNQYAGRFEKMDCNYIEGWAWDKNFPNTAVTVEVMEGTTVRASGIANIYRDILKTSGYGTGNYAFKIPMPLSLKDGAAHTLSIRVQGSTLILPGSPLSITCAANQYSGRFESADCNWIKGWAMDKNLPNTAVTVEVYEGNTIYATVTPTAFASGNYGFSVATPSSLMDGQPHQLSMRIKGTTTVLTDSPRALTCSVNQYAGRFEKMDCNYIEGWAWDKNFPNTAVTVEVMEGTTVRASGIANIYRDILKTSGYGTGNYAFKIPMPLSLKDGAAHTLSIRVQGSTLILPGSPLSITCAANQYSGRFESADCNWIKGWAMDKNLPNTAVTVEVYEGNTIYATVTPTAFASGNYGFSVATPSSLMDGQPHQLSMRIKGTTTVLTDSPRALTCSVNQYAGRFEKMDCNYIEGWAWDKNFPNTAVTVEVMEGTTVRASGIANIYRDILKTSGYGTGNYAFKIPMPLSLKDGAAHTLSIRVQGSTLILPGSPLSITCAANQYSGRFESADCNWIKGWAMDKNLPNTAVTVEVYEGNTIYATVTPTAFASGNYGFSVATPSSLMDGQPHQLSMRIKGTTTVLTDSPRALTCIVNQYAGRFDKSDCNFIEGWVWDKNFPATAVKIEVMEGTTVRATGTADQYREILKTLGYGTGNYGFKIPMPASLKDGSIHQLSIRVFGSSVILPGSQPSKACANQARFSSEEVIEKEVDEKSKRKNDFLVFPNPSSGAVWVDFRSLNNKRVRLRVVNILGQIVFNYSKPENEGQNKQLVDLSGQPNGIYIFQLQLGKELITKSIVINK